MRNSAKHSRTLHPSQDFPNIHNICFLLPQVTENIEFDKNFVGVAFDHEISPHYYEQVEDAYSSSEIEAMLQVISTRFSQVLVVVDGDFLRNFYYKTIQCSSDNSTIEGASRIPIIAANYNKLMKMTQTGFAPLNIKLVIELYADFSMQTNLDDVDHVLYLTLKANSIYPGTVSTLFLDMYPIKKSQNMSIQILSYIRKQNQKMNQNLQVGLLMFDSHCGMLGDIYVPTYTQEMLQHVDLVIFIEDPSSHQNKSGPQIASLSVIKSITECKRRLRRSFPSNLNIAWLTTAPSCAAGEYDSLNYTIMYWKFMSDWAAKTKELLYFVEAFDTAPEKHDDKADSERGWWRLKWTGTTNIAVNSFVEKITLLRNFSPDDAEPREENSVVAIPVSIIIFSVASVILFLLVGVVLFILYRKMRNMQTQRLSKDDYEEFMMGSSSLGADGKVDGNCSEDLLRLPYDKQQYELSKNSFTIDYTKLLGSGAFGYVYKGTIHDKGKEYAFKLTKPSCSVLTLKGLLSEIKLLSYLGYHENIVSLIGSYTAELQTGIVYVVTELCEERSLEKFLRAHQPNYYNVAGESTAKGIDIGRALNKTFEWERDMLRWSIEIASGLEFISSKHVVHADIAARNILLTSNLTAKISDFGLSRRMYDYTNYVKKQQEPLPWRWMSIEALRNLEFSEKSDIWAFGVTMWEIFSGGDTPYPGLSWNLGFVEELQKGLRLQRPQYSSEEIYNVMLECWHPNPADRVSFTKLKHTLMNLDGRNELYTDLSENL